MTVVSLSHDPAGIIEDFGTVVRRRAAHALVVQPRMGLPQPERMRAGLEATQAAHASTVGTITLDSYTRVGDWKSAARAVFEGADINGYPIVTHGSTTTRAVLDGVVGPGFPVQVRHGSASPEPIVEAMLASGLHTTEGGPVSYCLPYGRVPLTRSVEAWRSACRTLASARRPGIEPHLESFGGCLMGQLCPPELLVAIAVLEGIFFVQQGLRSISLSYSQQIHRGQDEEAIAALRRLADERLSHVDVHVVVYAYMGVYPRTAEGARGLLADAARLAWGCGAERLIVKTVAEAHRIPTVAENVDALETAAAAAAGTVRHPAALTVESVTYRRARRLIETVLALHDDVGRGLLQAFAHGALDVPFCLHPDNAGRSRSAVDRQGRLVWTHVGAMPIEPDASPLPVGRLTADGLLRALGRVRDRYDHRSGATDPPATHWVDRPSTTTTDRSVR